MRPEESRGHFVPGTSPPGLMSIIRALPRYSTLVGLLSCRSFFTTSAIRRAICAIVASGLPHLRVAHHSRLDQRRIGEERGERVVDLVLKRE